MAARAGPGPCRSPESLINRAIASILDREPGWSAAAAAAERAQAVAGAPSRLPGVVVNAGGSAAIIETGFEPAAALRGDVDRAAALRLADHGEPACVIGIVLPDALSRCRESDIEPWLLDRDTAVEYCVRSGEGGIFPASGFLRGGMADIRAAIRLASVPRGLIDKGYGLAVNGMLGIARLLRESAGKRAQGAICAMLGQDPDEYTWHMAALVLLNAATLYGDLAGRRDGAAPPAAPPAAGASPKDALLEAWRCARGIGHAPVLDSAIGILHSLPAGVAGEAIKTMAAVSSGLLATGAYKFGDFYGMLYQRQLYDRKRAAAFYTRPEAATLLAELVMRGPGDAAWHDEELLRKMRIADMACGSGSLLHAAYTHVVNCSSLDLSALHPDIMRNCLWGFDIFPTATHFAVSSLSSLFPGRRFGECRIYALRVGADEHGCHLGSLDLADESAPLGTAGGRLEGGASLHAGEATLRHGSCDYVIMNPPFIRSTDHGEHRKDPVPQYAVFGNAPEAQRAMSLHDKRLFRGTCAHGNAGFGSYFLALCHKKIRPGGRFGMILPDTVLSGESWSKARLLVSEWYDDITVVSVSRGSDGTYSADTAMREIMLVGERRRSRRAAEDARPRVKFVQLDQMPRSRLEALAVARRIKGTDAAILGDPAGGTALKIGGELAGSMVSCPIDGDRWWCRRAADASMLGLAYGLARPPPPPAGGADPARPPAGQAIRLTELGKIAKMGRLHRDIADGGRGGGRAPFRRLPHAPGSEFPCLWANDARTQSSMVVPPDCSLEEKPGAGAEAVQDAWSTRTRLHLNNNVGYGAQRLIAAYTERPTLGGRGWPNVLIGEKFEKAMAVWCNSALGLLSYWSASGSQQRGRGIMGITAFRKHFFVLDVRRLTGRQLSLFDGLFDRLCRRALLPFSDLERDRVRRDMDASMLKILDAGGMDLDRLYGWISSDPQFSAGTGS